MEGRRDRGERINEGGRKGKRVKGEERVGGRVEGSAEEARPSPDAAPS